MIQGPTEGCQRNAGMPSTHARAPPPTPPHPMCPSTWCRFRLSRPNRKSMPSWSSTVMEQGRKWGPTLTWARWMRPAGGNNNGWSGGTCSSARVAREQPGRLDQLCQAANAGGSQRRRSEAFQQQRGTQPPIPLAPTQDLGGAHPHRGALPAPVHEAQQVAALGARAAHNGHLGRGGEGGSIARSLL